jgi:hypothetical protein
LAFTAKQRLSRRVRVVKPFLVSDLPPNHDNPLKNLFQTTTQFEEASGAGLIGPADQLFCARGSLSAAVKAASMTPPRVSSTASILNCSVGAGNHPKPFSQHKQVLTEQAPNIRDYSANAISDDLPF